MQWFCPRATNRIFFRMRNQHPLQGLQKFPLDKNKEQVFLEIFSVLGVLSVMNLFWMAKHEKGYAH